MEHLNEIAAAFRQASIPCAAREPLSRHTSFQIGGPAALFCEPQNKRQLARAIAVCRQAGVRYYLLGKGTNILFADEGFDGVVIHIGEVLGNIECNGLSVTAQAGAALSKVCIGIRLRHPRVCGRRRIYERGRLRRRDKGCACLRNVSG